MALKAKLSPDVVTNVAFGLAGVLLTLFMIWQAATYAARWSQYLSLHLVTEKINALRANTLVAPGTLSASGPAALEASTPSDLESLPEPEQQGKTAVTSDEGIASPPAAMLSVHTIGHDVLVQWHCRQTADALVCTATTGGGLVMDASDEERGG